MVAKKVATAAAALMLLPTLAFAGGNADKGKDVFAQNCASCHGAAGKGDGVEGMAMDPKPRDLTDKAYMSKLSDQHIVTVVKKGGPAVGKSELMAPLGDTLNDEQINDVTAYVRSLSK